MFLRIAHRGAMGLEPENTLSAFRRALEHPIDMVEFDVHLCGSGELVVIHDTTVDRTTNGSGYVKDLDLDDIWSLDAGNGERIPTLDDVLDLLSGRVQVNVELKGKGTAGPVQSALGKRVSTGGWRWRDFLVSSFNPMELVDFKEANGLAGIGVILGKSTGGFEEFTEFVGAFSIHVPRDLIDRELVESAHDRGLKVLAWVVNDLPGLIELREIGVDGIFTDLPGIFCEYARIDQSGNSRTSPDLRGSEPNAS